jgi:hypothetical protein
MHEKGRGEPECAVGWFTRAADAGFPMAMHRLGCLNKAGEGVAAVDYQAAVGWYRKGVEAGLAVSMCCLGMLLDAGKGVAVPDYPAAADLYKVWRCRSTRLNPR